MNFAEPVYRLVNPSRMLYIKEAQLNEVAFIAKDVNRDVLAVIRIKGQGCFIVRVSADDATDDATAKIAKFIQKNIGTNNEVDLFIYGANYEIMEQPYMITGANRYIQSVVNQDGQDFYQISDDQRQQYAPLLTWA